MPYGAVILKWPGRITLSSGATTKIVDLPAGVSQEGNTTRRPRRKLSMFETTASNALGGANGER